MFPRKLREKLFHHHFSSLTFITACYIEIDDEEFLASEDESKSDSLWCNLPDLLLEEIYSYLSIRERLVNVHLTDVQDKFISFEENL